MWPSLVIFFGTCTAKLPKLTQFKRMIAAKILPNLKQRKGLARILLRCNQSVARRRNISMEYPWPLVQDLLSVGVVTDLVRLFGQKKYASFSVG